MLHVTALGCVEVLLKLKFVVALVAFGLIINYLS